MKLNPILRLNGSSAALGRRLRAGLAVLTLALAAFAPADIIVPGADGSDGELVGGGRLIDLSLATTGRWDQPGNGNGVYDPQKWAVVFKYSRVDLQGLITFKNHPSGAPVVWLVKEFVRGDSNSSIYLDATTLIPGPGGFRGGVFTGGYGFGPGAGGTAGGLSQASHALLGSNGGPIYSNEKIIPLIGGSGANDGAGGGAILIACQGRLGFFGIRVLGAENGSGGAIRLVADEIAFGTIDVRSRGRVRFEANNFVGSPTIVGAGSASFFDGPISTAQIWPTDTHPKVGIVQIHGISAPTDPRARLEEATTDLAINAGGPVVVRMEALNVPSTWKIEVKVVPKTGRPIIAEATKVEGNDLASFWQANVQFPAGASVIQARAYRP